MAIQSKRNFLGAMRIDTNMLRAVESGVASDFSTLVNSVLTSGDPAIQTYVVRGFSHTGTTTSTFSIDLADSVFLSQNSDRSMFVFPSDVEPVRPFLNGVGANTYYVGFKIEPADGVVQQMAFKDPVTKVEYYKTVPTAKELVYTEPYFDTAGTNPDVTFIYKVVVGISGNVTVSGLSDATGNRTEYFLTFDGQNYDSLTEWAAAVEQAGTSVTMGGDVEGFSDDATVVGLQGKPFDGTPTDGQVPVFDADADAWVFGASNAVASRTFYVAVDGSNTTGNGSLTAPFATVTKALEAADELTVGARVAIELLPGIYSENVLITRYNTILRGLQANSRGLSHKIAGCVTVECDSATQKNNNVVAIQGLFIEPPSSSTDAAVHVTGSGLFSVLIDNCYLTTLNGDGSANALLVDNDNVGRVRVSVSNSILTIQEGGPDIVSFEHGDGRMNSCELYFGSTVDADTVSGAIVIDNAASLFADRLLIDVSSINEAVHVTGGTNWPKLTISNSSINNRYNGANSHCIYMDISSPATPALFSWQNAFTTRNSNASAIINNTGNAPALVIHGQTTLVPNAAGLINSKVTNCTLVPMTEMHGNLIIPSKKAVSGTYALTIDTNGNVNSQAFPTGDVASVGNASGDTSVTVAGTGSGPWTGAVTVKLPDVIAAGGPVGSNGVTIPVISYDKYGRLTTVTSSPLNIEYTSGQYKTVKQYVDDLAFGLSGKDPVAAATIAALADAYDVSPDGLVLTKKTGNGALAAVDGVTPTVGMRLLIKDEPAAGNLNYNNGIYVVTAVGDGSNKWVLTRSADANSPTSLCGSLVPVSVAGSPNTNGGTLWTFAKNPTGFTIGSSAVTFTSVTASTPNATTTTTGKVQLAGALGGTSSSATAPVVDLATDGNFSGTLSLTKVKGPSSDKAVAISSGANTWSATGLTGTSKLVGFISDGTPTAITLGTNLSLSGSILNATLSSAVTSIIAGTGVSVSGGTGDVTVSIGQSVATSATPTFAGLTVNAGGAVTLGQSGSKLNTLEMNTTSTWTGLFGGAVNLNSTAGMHFNTDSTNGGNVNLSKSGFTTAIGGNLTATSAATVTLGNVSTTSTVNGVVKLPDVYNVAAKAKILSIASDGTLGSGSSIAASAVTNIPYDISGDVFGAPVANAIVFHFKAARSFSLTRNLEMVYSVGCETAPTVAMNTTPFRVFRCNPDFTSPVELMSFYFPIGNKVGTVTIHGNPAAFSEIKNGQIVYVQAPSTAIAGLSNVFFTFTGTVD
jgi:hypothetical protein